MEGGEDEEEEEEEEGEEVVPARGPNASESGDRRPAPVLL
jgi:hypothetical protein